MDIGILLFDQVDLLDFGGPYEVFLTASRLARRAGGPAPFEVYTIGFDDRPVQAYGGVRLVPDRTVAEVETLDVLIVPGAIAIDEVAANGQVPAAIDMLAQRAGIVASVCTGAFLLARAGLLDGSAWTTHWEDVALLAERIGAEGARRSVRWVDSGRVVTSGGLASGIAMAIHLVNRLSSYDLADATARQLEYDWQPDGERPAARP